MLRFLSSLLLLCLVYIPVQADERIPAYLVRLPQSVRTVFVAETSTAAFHRFENAAGSEIDYLGATDMSYGENGDGKQRDGDGRTPLGIYFVTEQLDTSRMHEKYGVTAFVLDYPNALDRRLQRSGDMHAFLSLYDADFRHWGMNKAEWTALLTETYATRPIQKVTVSDVLLLADPEEDGIYLSRFRLSMEEESNTVELTKRLYWRRGGTSVLTVIAEDSG